jgi:hypothetical protein
MNKVIEQYKEKYGVVKVDLACGNRKHSEDCIGLDCSAETDANIVWDLNQYPWPLEDNSVDEVFCNHYIEHIPHDAQNGNKTDGFIQFMNEVYRILKPTCKANFVAPYYTSVRAYGDPTHCRQICDWTFLYYNKEWRDNNKLSHYGITADFDIHYSYSINEEMSLRSEPVRNKAFRENWNAVEDIIVEVTKR